MRNDDRPPVLTLLSDFVFANSLVELCSSTERIPTPTVDIALPLFGATAPAPLLPEDPRPREFFEPVEGLAMREMFETGVITGLFGSTARPETLGFTRVRR